MEAGESETLPEHNTERKIRLIRIITLALGFVLFWFMGFYFGSRQTPFQKTADTQPAQKNEIAPTAETVCGIEKSRLSDPVLSGGNQYLIFRRNSMNIVLTPDSGNYQDSGILVNTGNNPGDCKKIIDIFDETPAKNNIYELYNDKNSLYVLAADHLGAGSGEGNAKVLKSTDNGKTWVVTDCFYYVPSEWKTLQDFITNKPAKLKQYSLTNPVCKNFILGVEGGRLK